ncbi:hypothetical protein C8R44DRAFT_770869 [Mycena epipterygia]|nr:hypothetical protein C8R44DRAFT_770869 [Mycena epipterygia]
MVYKEILPTLSHPPGQGVWTFRGSAIIDAPAIEVWNALKDFQSYSKWNLYTPTIDTPSRSNAVNVGDRITLHYRPEPTGNTMPVLCEIIAFSDEEMSISWCGQPTSIPTWVFLLEKIQCITPKGEQQCLYEGWETQSGPMAYAYLVKWSIGAKLSAMQQGMADGLKEYVEGNAE